MATTPGTRPRGTRTDIGGNEDRDTLNTMQEPLGSMDRPGSRTSDINEVNLPPGETVRRTGNLGMSNDPVASTTTARTGRSFTSTFAIAAVVLLVAFLIAIYLGSNRNDVATTGGMQAPVADTDTGTTGDTTGSTTAPSQQTAPGTGDAGGNTAGSTGEAGGTTGGTGTTTPTAPANP